MTKQEIGELLNEIDRFKNNIKECDGILRTLREIQLNYESAVEQPKDILQKLNALTARMTVEFDELGEKYVGLLNMSNMQAENLQNSTKTQIDELIQETKSSYETLTVACANLEKALQEDKNSFIERVSVLLEKVDALSTKVTDKLDDLENTLLVKQEETMAQMFSMQEKNERKINALSKIAIGGAIGTVISIALLITLLII